MLLLFFNGGGSSGSTPVSPEEIFILRRGHIGVLLSGSTYLEI